MSEDLFPEFTFVDFLSGFPVVLLPSSCGSEILENPDHEILPVRNAVDFLPGILRPHGCEFTLRIGDIDEGEIGVIFYDLEIPSRIVPFQGCRQLPGFLVGEEMGFIH